jgi:hypothetical protein
MRWLESRGAEHGHAWRVLRHRFNAVDKLTQDAERTPTFEREGLLTFDGVHGGESTGGKGLSGINTVGT